MDGRPGTEDGKRKQDVLGEWGKRDRRYGGDTSDDLLQGL